MSQEENKEFEMAVGTSSILESNIMDGGENFYTPMESATEPEPAAETNWNVLKNDTGQLCRSCANSSDYLIPIYEGEGLEHQLEYKIQKHLPIQVSSTDTLPLQLCYQCASTLIAWDSMINSCIEADKKLRAMQEAAEEVKQNQSTEDSQADADNEANAEPEVADSDDEPLIASKSKLLSEKNVVDKEATPLKKKILSKTKSKSVTAKTEKTVQVSKEGDDKERDAELGDDRLWGVEVKVEKTDENGAEPPLASIDVNMIKKESNSTSVYECQLCNMTYASNASLERHVTHVHSRKVKCSECDAEVPKKCYRLHLKNEHGLLQPKSDSNDENENEKEKSSEGPSNNGIMCYPGVVCSVCNQVYSNDLNLKKHMYNVHRMIRVKCNVCDKEVNKKSLVRHMKNVHSAQMSFKKDKIPEDEKVPCTYCGKKCSSSISLLNHVRSVHEAEQYKCSKCEFEGTRKHLERHIRKQHNDEVYQCGSCQKILKSKSTLKEHMWIHSDQRRYICAICGLQFKRTSNYHGHMKSHQGKKFQCRICGNFFLRKRYLAVHEQTIHNYYGEGVPPQEKRYQCEICGVKLKWKNNLLAHMRIHTGERPYKCKICCEDFTCHGSLRTHMVKHSVCPTGLDDSNSLIQQAYLGQQKAHASSGMVTPSIKND